MLSRCLHRQDGPIAKGKCPYDEKTDKQHVSETVLAYVKYRLLMCMAMCCKYECKLPVLVINTLQIVVYEKILYLFEITVSYSSNSTALC